MNILHEFFRISTQVAATDDGMRSFLTKLMTIFSALLKMFRDTDLALRLRHHTQTEQILRFPSGILDDPVKRGLGTSPQG